MKTILSLSLAGALLFAAATTCAADQTWTGQIGDSACGVKHDSEMIGEGANKLTDRECTEACIRGGSLYILVVGDKAFKIANQKDPALATHAGHMVNVTGELKGDTITVSKIEMPAK